MTTLWFAGAENPSHHVLFDYCSVDRVALNVGSYHRNYKNSFKGLGFEVHDWIAWSDSPVTLDEVLEAFEAMGKPPTYVVLPPVDWSEDLDQFLPLWNGEGSFPTPTVGYRGLVVSDRVFSDKSLNNVVLSSKRRDSVLGVVTGKSKGGIERYDFVITNAWWSSLKHGETQVWDGIKLNRYNATNKLEKRQQHSEDIQALGVNEWDVMADDPAAVACLAIKSWQALEVFRLDLPEEPEASSGGSEEEANGGSEMVVVDTRRVRERHVLPSMTAYEEVREDESGNVLDTSLVVGSSHDSLRKCDNCYLSASCPAYNPGHQCAYSIPVTVRTKDQLQNVMQAMLEIQTQRVFQLRFAEEVNGQELSTDTGREMDRLFDMTKKMRDIMDNRDSVKVSIESRGGGGGVLSKLFGSEVGQNAKALATPVKSDDVIDVLADD